MKDCDHCKYHKRVGFRWGECRRYPPMPGVNLNEDDIPTSGLPKPEVPGEGDGEARPVWPITGLKDWCGEFEPP